MEPSPLSKFKPGVYQGTPDAQKEKKMGVVRPVRTMKSDVAEAIRDQNETTVSIAVAEQKKRAQEQAAANEARKKEAGQNPPAPKRVGRLVVIIVVLLFIALLGAGYVFVLPKLNTIKLPSVTLPSLPSFTKTTDTPIATSTEPTTPKLANSLVPAQSEKRFNISNQARGQISQEIRNELSTGDTVGNIKNLYFVEGSEGSLSELSADKFAMFSGVTIPDILARSLEKNFMTGLITESMSTSTPFVILKVSEHELAFAGMLEGEALLPNLFDNVFGTDIGATISAGSKFHDVILLGKDARIVNTTTDRAIAYAFADKNTLIIAGSKTALEALIPLASKN